MSSKGVDVVTSAADDGRGLFPKLRFPEFRDAGEWTPASIGQFLTESRIVGGKGDSARKLTVKLWGGGVFAKSETRRGSENTQYYKRSAGQFIYSKLDFLNQAFGLIPAQLDGFESTVDLPCFDIGAGLSPRFLLEYVQRDQFFRRKGELADGGRKAKRIQVEDFLSFSIDLPPLLAEQKKIADCLSSLDDLIAAEGDRLAALRKYKKGLMQQLFPRPERVENGKKIPAETTPRLRFPDFQNAGYWEERPLGDLLERPPAYGVNAAAVPYDQLLPTYLRITDISEDGRFIDADKTSVNVVATESNSMQPNDIALTRTGASVGKAYLHTEANGPLIFAGFLIRVRPDQRRALSQILFQYLQTQAYWSWVLKTSARSGQPGLNSAEYSALRVPLPPDGPDGLREQRQIANCLSSIDDLAVALTDRIAALKAHKTALMQQLFPSPPEMSA